MDSFGKLALAIVCAYLVYEFATFYIIRREKTDPYADEDPVVGKVATVSVPFSGMNTVKTGKVVLNGTQWQAETSHSIADLEPGSRCRVVSRNGLTLTVESES